MEKVIVNETPIRTSRNFGINNIKLENIVLPENLNKFENVKIRLYAPAYFLPVSIVIIVYCPPP